MSAITAMLVATLLGQGYYTPEEAQELFAKANEAYTREDYATARDGYEKLISHGQGGPDVLYNLGTTYLAQGDLGHAVLSLERAWKAGGRAPDLDANLALARAQQKDKVEGAAVEEDFVTRLVKATPETVVGRGVPGRMGGGLRAAAAVPLPEARPARVGGGARGAGAHGGAALGGAARRRTCGWRARSMRRWCSPGRWWRASSPRVTPRCSSTSTRA